MGRSQDKLWGQKLAPPHATFPVVPRAQASERVAAHEGVSLVLVSAPAGFGKTALLRSLYEQRRDDGEHVMWLSLDAADNDPQRFLEYLGAALAAPAAGVAEAPAAASFETVIARVAELTRSNEPFSVFLDDVQVLGDPSVTGLARDLIGMVPAHGTLFLAGRRMPDLQIARLRAQGRVLELGPGELRFSPSESEQMLTNVLGRSLGPELVASLHERTEGWAAALQLAALALRQRRDQTDYVAGFSGTSEELSSYLAEEILATQPEDVRALLLRASICDTVCADLVDHVCGISDSEALLRRIERDNLFLFPLDDAGEWLRFHDLFADFLRRELRRHHAAEVAPLHRRAAEWFVIHDKKTSALEHAVQCEDMEYAADLADTFAQPLTSSGRLSTLIRAVQPLPKAAVDRRPRLKVYYAVCLTGAFQHRAAAPVIAELDAPEVIAALDPVTRGSLLFGIPFQMLIRDRFADALAASEEHLQQLDSDDAQSRTALMNVRSVCLLHLRRFRDVTGAAAETRGLATGVTEYGLAYAECIAGMSELAQGRLSSAAAIFEATLATALSDSPNSAPTAIAAACVAEAAYAAGNLDRAAQLLERHLPTITHNAIPDGVIRAHVHRIRLAYLLRGYADACEAVDELKRLGYERDLPRVVATAWAEHSRLALLRGDAAGAERYLKMAETGGPYTTLWDESGTTLRARLLVANDRAADALPLLDEALAGLDASECRREALTLRLVRASALRATGRTAEALDAVEACVDEARLESQVRALADEGAPLIALLRELLATREVGTDTWAFVGAALTGPPDVEHEAGEAPDVLREALSVRELEVLGHLADGFSNQEIADTLVISLHTVKTHVRSIMGKLAAKNRTEAVAAARRHDLLAP